MAEGRADVQDGEEGTVVHMGKLLRLFHYSNTTYAPGDVVHGKGNHIPSLTSEQQLAEQAIRAALKDGERIRGSALYTWENEALARRLCAFARKKFLYELEASSADVLFRGDLNYYTETGKDAAAGRAVEESVSHYVAGDEGRPPQFSESRMEVLVAKALVVRVLLP